MKYRRNTKAGVTLIEMLVVLVLLGVMAGALALALPRRANEASVETTALALAASLRRAVRFALDHQSGFGVRADQRGYQVLLRAGDKWVAHLDPALTQLKLFPRSLRIDSYNNGATYEVTQYLEPVKPRVWKLAIGQGPAAKVVIFDGFSARIRPLGDE